jgi:hypothetical protein
MFRSNSTLFLFMQEFTSGLKRCPLSLSRLQTVNEASEIISAFSSIGYYVKNVNLRILMIYGVVI